MSVAVNTKGRKRSDINASLRAHQIRENEKDAKKILKDTASQIDPKLSHMNKNYFDDPDRLQEMRDKIDTISDKRREAGGKKVYKSANVFIVGTLQIGDDSLEALGWKSEGGKKLPADQQSVQTLRNVELVYDDMLQSVKRQPEIYGDIFSATLHMDEGSPHVDFMSDPLDTEKPDRLARHFLNGPKGTPKGHNLSVMQDNIMKYSRFSEETIEKFGLVRGDGTSKRLNTARELRYKDNDLNKREKQFRDKNKAFNAQVSKFRDGAKVVSDEQARRSSNLDARAVQLDNVSKGIKDKEKVLDRRESDLGDKESELNVKDVEVSNKLLEAEWLKESAKKLEESAKRLMGTFQEIVEKIRSGDIRPDEVLEVEERVKRSHEPYNSANAEHLDAMNNALLELTDDDLEGLGREDSQQL